MWSEDLRPSLSMIDGNAVMKTTCRYAKVASYMVVIVNQKALAY